LGLGLRRRGTTGRFTFAEGEETLSGWLAENAFVSWLQCPAPWDVEARLVQQLSLPLNLAGNKGHPFHLAISLLRRQARQRADAHDVAHPVSPSPGYDVSS